MLKEKDVFYLDCLGLCVEGRLQDAVEEEATGRDFARILDPIRETDYSAFFKAQYNTITDSRYDFGFTRRELHHFVAMAPNALDRIKTPKLEMQARQR
jgi:hypothetical protein